MGLAPSCCPAVDAAMPGLSHNVPLKQANDVYGCLLEEAGAVSLAGEKDDGMLSALREIQQGGGAELTPGVFALGHRTGRNANNAYLLRLSGYGNIMIDCPEFSEVLADAIGRLGGIAMIFCTGSGGTCGTQWNLWKARFPALQRVMHARDGREGWKGAGNERGGDEIGGDSHGEVEGTDKCGREGECNTVEVVLTGHGPFRQLGCVGVEALHVPGHTSGASVLHLEGIAAFTGDHLALEFDDRDHSLRLDSIMALAEDWTEARKSMMVLAQPDIKFLWVLPAHGEPFRFRDQEERVRMLHEVVDDMGLCADSIPWASLHDDEITDYCVVED